MSDIVSNYQRQYPTADTPSFTPLLKLAFNGPSDELLKAEGDKIVPADPDMAKRFDAHRSAFLLGDLSDEDISTNRNTMVKLLDYVKSRFPVQADRLSKTTLTTGDGPRTPKGYIKEGKPVTRAVVLQLVDKLMYLIEGDELARPPDAPVHRRTLPGSQYDGTEDDNL